MNYIDLVNELTAERKNLQRLWLQVSDIKIGASNTEYQEYKAQVLACLVHSEDLIVEATNAVNHWHAAALGNVLEKQEGA